MGAVMAEVNEMVDLDAAEAGLLEALTRDDLFRLGLICSTDVSDEKGERPADYVAAHKWFNLAAMLGSVPAKAYRDEIAFELQSDEVTRAQRDAREWLRGNRAILQKEAA